MDHGWEDTAAATRFIMRPGFIHLTNETTYAYIEHPYDMIDPFHSNSDFMAIVLTHAITFIFGIIGNSVVIATWARGGKIRSSTATFLVSLACADLLLLIIFMPLETLEYFVVTWDSDGHICKLSSFVELLSGMSSILNLVAVSVERFLVIVYPIQARRWCTVTKSRRSLVIVWLLAVLLAVPPVFNKSTYSMTYYNNETSVTAYYCFEKNDAWAIWFSIYELLTLFVIPATLMMFCYSRVIRELWASTRIITVLTSSGSIGHRLLSTSSRRSFSELAQTPLPTGISFSGTVDHSASGHTYLVRWRSSPVRRTSGGTFPVAEPPSSTTTSSSGQRDQSTSQRWSKTNRSRCMSPDVECVPSRPSSLNTAPQVAEVHNARRQLYCQVIKMLLFIVILFHVCWGPRLIFNVIKSLGLAHFDSRAYNARVYFYLLSFIHSALNPFVYGFMSSNFRRMMCGKSQDKRRRNRRRQYLKKRNNRWTETLGNGSLADAMATTSCLNMPHLTSRIPNSPDEILSEPAIHVNQPEPLPSSSSSPSPLSSMSWSWSQKNRNPIISGNRTNGNGLVTSSESHLSAPYAEIEMEINQMMVRCQQNQQQQQHQTGWLLAPPGQTCFKLARTLSLFSMATNRKRRRNVSNKSCGSLQVTNAAGGGGGGGGGNKESPET